jgi:hypothetical protein
VALPVGGWHYADHDGHPQLVAWVTTEPLAEAGSAWLALSTEHPLTGLVPVMLAGNTTDVSEALGVPAAADRLPYFGFHYPAGAALLDLKSAGDELDTGWGERTVFPSSAHRLRRRLRQGIGQHRHGPHRQHHRRAHLKLLVGLTGPHHHAAGYFLLVSGPAGNFHR